MAAAAITEVIAGQTVFLGEAALKPLLERLLAAGVARPLVVSDPGLAAVGVVDTVLDALRGAGLAPAVFAETEANPSAETVARIAGAFVAADCDFVVGVGGGGPLDAAKGAAAVVAAARTTAGFDAARDGAAFVVGPLRAALAAGDEALLEAVPGMAAVPTTAGTGSEGGKSAVITDASAAGGGAKVIFGHPALLPRYAALAPQLTAALPPALTAATGADALLHSLEAFFVPRAVAEERDGMAPEAVAACEAFALEGAALVRDFLPRAVADGDDLEARLALQRASLYGAKAFAKGDLGGVHATAHALGAEYHLHHGSAILRMAAPVVAFNEDAAAAGSELEGRLRDVGAVLGGDGPVSERLGEFLEQFGLPQGTADIMPDVADAVVEKAVADGCQTNPVPLAEGDYRKIFGAAAGW